MSDTIDRIPIKPDKLGGQPCIRGLRIAVEDVLGYLASGMSETEILDEFPDLQHDEFLAIYRYAASLAGSQRIPSQIPVSTGLSACHN